jgi:hypothetical protein
MYVQSTPSERHREHLTPPSHLRCRLLHGTQATATDVLLAAAFAAFCASFAACAWALSDLEVCNCAGGVWELTLSKVVELPLGDICMVIGDESEKS